MHSLPIFVRLAGRRVILVGSGPAADAKRRLLERTGANLVDETAEASLAIVAIDDDAEAEAAAARLKARGVLVNAVDRPALCDFTLPAIVDRDPVIVAVGTGGASAGLAKALRQRLEELLPTGLGRLAAALSESRDAIRQRWPDAGDRRRAIDAALDGPLDPLVEHRLDAVPRWLRAADPAPERGVLRIRLRSIDPDDLTLREARLLGQADRIYHDAEVPAAILDRARADAERVPGPPPDVPMTGLTLDIRMEPR